MLRGIYMVYWFSCLEYFLDFFFKRYYLILNIFWFFWIFKMIELYFGCGFLKEVFYSFLWEI